MVASRIKELISVTRRAARNVRQTFEEVTEQLISQQRQKHLEVSLQKVPVRNTQNQHPLLNRSRSGRRNFSTSSSSRYYSTARTAPLYLRKPSVTSFSRNVVRQVQPFRYNTRVGVQLVSRGGLAPGSLYSHFANHNARMFSTYGQNMAAQAVNNLTMGLRATFIKGYDLNSKLLFKDHTGSINANKAFVDEDMKLARADSEHTNDVSGGCVLDFNLTSCLKQTEFLPEKFILDDEILLDFEKFYIKREFDYRMAIMNDIKTLKEKIGTPSIENLEFNGQIIVRCHFPNCEASKMEVLLADSGITTGVVRSAGGDLNRATSPESFSDFSSSSSFSLSDFVEESQDDSTVPSVLSTDLSSVSDESNIYFYYHQADFSTDGLEFIEPEIAFSDVYSDFSGVIIEC